MADLRDLFASLRYRDVRTVLNSGNVVFTAGGERTERIAGQIQRTMLERLGVAARVMVLTRGAYATVVEENALRLVTSDPARLLVAFCVDARRLREFEPLARKDWGPEAIAVGSVAAYAWCPRGILESELLAAIGRALGESITTRNWGTVTRIYEVLQS
jgi:uncharacterized protein (DUF1697 family)